MLTSSEIKSFEVDINNECTDDGDPLYEGDLTILLNNGTILRAELDWIREGDKHFLCDKKDVEYLIEYITDHEIEFS